MMVSCGYINNFKGRENRTEQAKHLRDEFEAVEAAFVGLAALSAKTFSTVYTNTEVNETTFEVDPANGAFQEVTINNDITLTIKNPTGPADDAATKRVSLLIHGSSFKVINGWGPQVWKERGPDDWIVAYTGTGQHASMLIDFVWDGLAWVAIISSKNQNVEGVAAATQATFPFVKDLTNVAGTETLGFSRTGSATVWDTNERYWLLPADTPRFGGSRYVLNWVAQPNDLQGVAWEEDGAAVTTEVAGGPTGGDTDKITFTTTGGDVRCWLLPHFGRSAQTSDPMKFVVRFKGKMASVASGSFRLVMALMGNTSESPAVHRAKTVSLDDDWQDYGFVFDMNTGIDDNSYDLTNSDEKRTLTGLMFKSPSGATGDPILIEGVQIEPLREGYPEIPSELQSGSIGASLTLAATSGSTGTWDNGTKAMTLDNEEYVDFKDSLEIGKSYLVVAERTGGSSADVIMREALLYWEANLNISDPKFVKDAPFVIRYEGGNLRFRLSGGASSAYTVNIYECTDNESVYDTELGNSLVGTTLTDGTGAPVSSLFSDGLVIENVAVTNLIPFSQYRSFYNWTKVGLTGSYDVLGKVSSYRGEYGIDGLPNMGTALQDRKTNSSGYVKLNITIPADTNEYTFSWFTRKVFDAAGDQQYTPEYDNLSTNPSEWLDVVCTMSNDAGDSHGGDRVRIEIKNGHLRPDSLESVTDYSGRTLLDLQDWWYHALSLTNDGTMTDFEIQIYPAAGNTNTQSPTANASLRGWVVIDWAQLEKEVGTFTASGPVVGGETRSAEALSTALADGTLYDQNSNEIGDVDGGVFAYDQVDTVYKNVLWSTEEVILLYSAAQLHEFGPENPTCSETLDDDAGEPILDSSDNAICTGETPESVALIGAAAGLIVWYDFQGNDPEVITPIAANVVDLTEYDLTTLSLSPTPEDNFVAARRSSMGQAYESNQTSSGQGDDLIEANSGYTIGDIRTQMAAPSTTEFTMIFTFATGTDDTVITRMALWHSRVSWPLQGFSVAYSQPSGTDAVMDTVMKAKSGSQSTQRITDSRITDGELHVVAARVNGTAYDLWFDGEKNSTVTMDASGIESEYDLSWGDYGGWSAEDTDGAVTDLFVLYDNALTDTEIEDICNAIVSEVI